MTEKIINFRTGKKRKLRADKEKLAEQNRVKFGRTKSQKAEQTRLAETAKTHLDNHKIVPKKPQN